MHAAIVRRMCAVAVLALIVGAAAAGTPEVANPFLGPTFVLTQAPPPQPPPPPSPPPGARPAPAAPAAPAKEEMRVTTKEEPTERAYRGVNDFFNIREAYSDVAACEWMIGAGAEWYTRDVGLKDHVELQQYIKYGITDDLHVALRVSQPLGYSGRGVGETELTIFNTFWRERDDWVPAFAAYATLRIPTGYESSDVDGTYGGIFTKRLNDQWRVHFEGWVKTACGVQGHKILSEDPYVTPDIRDFQWGVGPGVDFELSENTLIVANYLFKTSEYENYGRWYEQQVEAGLTHRFCETDRSYQMIKVAAQVDPCNSDDLFHLGAKVQWEIYLR